jgi:hypothetical protein
LSLETTPPVKVHMKRNILFYTYVLIDPRNGLPIYIGKGCRGRMYDHWKHMLSDRPTRNNFLRRILKQMLGEGYTSPIYEKWFEGDESFCEWMENYIIDYLGLKNLCNLTEGGEGTSGYLFTEEQRLIRKLATIARWADPDNRAKIMNGMMLSDIHGVAAAANILQWQTEYPEEFAAHCVKVGERLVEQMKEPALRVEAQRLAQIVYDTPEYKAKASALRIQEYIDHPELREAISKRQIAKFADPAEREKSSIIAIEIWKRPGYREHMLEVFAVSHNTPEYIALRSMLTTIQMQNPAAREVLRQAQLEYWSDAEYRERMREIQIEVQSRPEIVEAKREVMTELMNFQQGKEIIAKSVATRSTPEYSVKAKKLRKELLDTHLEYKQVIIENINSGRAKWVAKSLALYEDLMVKMLSLFTPEGLSKNDILRLMREKYETKTDRCEGVCKLALSRNLIFKAPGNKGKFFMKE